MYCTHYYTTDQLKSFAAHLFWNTVLSSGDMQMPYIGYVGTVMADLVLMRSSAQHLLVFEMYCGVKLPSICLNYQDAGLGAVAYSI